MLYLGGFPVAPERLLANGLPHSGETFIICGYIVLFFRLGKLAFVAGEEICSRREEFELMVLACEIRNRLKDMLPRPELLADTEILAHLFGADRCHWVKKYRGDPDDIEDVRKRL